MGDGSVDLVTAYILFHEVPTEAAKAICAEAARILRPGGVFNVVDFQTGNRVSGTPFRKFISWAGPTCSRSCATPASKPRWLAHATGGYRIIWDASQPERKVCVGPMHLPTAIGVAIERRTCFRLARKSGSPDYLSLGSTSLETYPRGSLEDRAWRRDRSAIDPSGSSEICYLRFSLSAVAEASSLPRRSGWYYRCPTPQPS